MDVKHDTRRDERIDIRFNKAFPVILGSEVFGDSSGVARNISAGGMYVEVLDPPPLGTVVSVHFQVPETGDEIIARAEVKHHYCFNFGSAHGPAVARGVGLRFVEFLEQNPELGSSSFTRDRVIH